MLTSWGSEPLESITYIYSADVTNQATRGSFAEERISWVSSFSHISPAVRFPKHDVSAGFPQPSSSMQQKKKEKRQPLAGATRPKRRALETGLLVL